VVHLELLREDFRNTVASAYSERRASTTGKPSTSGAAHRHTSIGTR
jgi:hypothetical protein